nr:MAG TPA: hypothetical protein [Caudoviricetes sp.]
MSNRRQGSVRPLAVALYVFCSNAVNTFKNAVRIGCRVRTVRSLLTAT